MASLNSRIKKIEEILEAIQAVLADLSVKVDVGKQNPTTLTTAQQKFNNEGMVFDGTTGFWKTYAVYKDDEEEEEEE